MMRTTALHTKKSTPPFDGSTYRERSVPTPDATCYTRPFTLARGTPRLLGRGPHPNRSRCGLAAGIDPLAKELRQQSGRIRRNGPQTAVAVQSRTSPAS